MVTHALQPAYIDFYAGTITINSPKKPSGIGDENTVRHTTENTELIDPII